MPEIASRRALRSNCLTDASTLAKEKKKGHGIAVASVCRSRRVARERGENYLGATAPLICSMPAWSSSVVRSPGSRPSAIAWIERRSTLPERVLGSWLMM